LQLHTGAYRVFFLILNGSMQVSNIALFFAHHFLRSDGLLLPTLRM